MADLPAPSDAPAASAARREPWALRNAGWVVAAATILSIGLVTTQVGWDWPFGPATTTTSTTNAAGEITTTDQRDQGASREALFRTITGVAALAAGILAWGRLEQSRGEHRLALAADRRAVDAQLHASRMQESVEVGQVTERYTRAVEQLGSAQIAVRLGALYALERLAQDSPADRTTIAEVICAWIRHHSLQRQPDSTLITADEDLPLRVDGQAIDYRAALAIVLRFPNSGTQELLMPFDLAGAVISNVVIDGAAVPWHLLDLADVRLDRVVIMGGEIVNAKWIGCELDHVTFESCSLRLIYWPRSTLNAVRIQRCDVTNLMLHGTTLQDVTFASGQVAGVEFEAGSAECSIRFLGGVVVQDVTLRSAVQARVRVLGGSTLRDVHLDMSVDSLKIDGDTHLDGVKVPDGVFDRDPRHEQRADGRWYSVTPPVSA